MPRGRSRVAIKCNYFKYESAHTRYENRNRCVSERERTIKKEGEREREREGQGREKAKRQRGERERGRGGILADANIRIRARSDAIHVVHVSEHAGRAYVNDTEMTAA